MEKYKHILLKWIKDPQQYRPNTWGSSEIKLPNRNRAEHAQKLLYDFSKIEEQDQKKENKRNWRYLEFSSSGNFDLVFSSLERKSKKKANSIELLNTRIEENQNGEKITKATVFIPYGKENIIKNKIIKYNEENSQKTGLPKNNNLILGIENIKLATIEDFWTDRKNIPDITSNKEWFEIWLNIEDNNVKEDNKQIFIETLNSWNIKYKNSFLQFPENLVMIILANKADLEYIIEHSDYISEMKLAKEVSTLIWDASKVEQAEWADELLSRVKINDSNSRVFILDTWINEWHPLLKDLVDKKDTIEPSWWDYDDQWHWTWMAWVVAYGDIIQKLQSSEDVEINYKLGSIKILPPKSQWENPKELWWDFTKRAISRAEIISPFLNSYCLAITAWDDMDKWRPSSWSSSVDQIIYNEGEKWRNILISTWNSNIHNESFPDYCKISEIEDPAQAWNAITVWAYTDKTAITTKTWTFTPYSKWWEMSPHNRTSFNFLKWWPIKPEVVFEWWNKVKWSLDWEFTDLDLLTTSHDFTTYKEFTYIWWTSASTANAWNFLWELAFHYSTLLPETIRWLMIHSSSWTKEMLEQFWITDIKTASKEKIRELIKCVGYWVPDIEKAIHSKENSLSMIIEETIQPYKKLPNKSNATLNEIHFYELPWPKDELIKLWNAEVKMKITLSYFIEPSPWEKWWKNKYKYQSHSLKFDLNNRLETKEEFQKRLNLEARDEDEEYESSTWSWSERWVIWSNTRNNWTVRSDLWIWTAIELANCNILAITPLGGWWKERPSEQKINNTTKYSLIISLETEETEIELYTAIQNKIKVEVPIPIQR